MTTTSQLTAGEVRNGKKHGPWITHYANGNIRSEGTYDEGKKTGLWIQYHQNGQKAAEGTFRNGLYEGTYKTWHENGKLASVITYGKHVGKSYDGKKEGPATFYEEDGKTVWRIITYKRGSRAKEDEFPLGTCPTCSHAIRLASRKKCLRCGEHL